MIREAEEVRESSTHKLNFLRTEVVRHRHLCADGEGGAVQPLRRGGGAELFRPAARLDAVCRRIAVELKICTALSASVASSPMPACMARACASRGGGVIDPEDRCG